MQAVRFVARVAVDGKLPEARAHGAAVYRRFANEPDRFVPTSADTRILAGDEVFILVAMEDIRPVLRLFHQALPPVRSMMIAGGGNIGLQLARTLQDHIQLKIVDASLSRCEHLSTTLDSSVLVLQGDTTDENLLGDEGIEEVDLFLALTGRTVHLDRLGGPGAELVRGRVAA